MSNRKFKVGIIGAGGIARSTHIPGWRSLPETEVVAVADSLPGRAQAVAQEHGIAQAFTDFRDLLKLQLDAVDICAPNRVHTPAVLAALQSGKHVLCEKPLAVTAREVRQMGRLADRRKLMLMTAQFQRFTTASVAAKSWVEAGGLGAVYHARVRAMRRALLPVAPGFIDARLSGGGPCLDIGVHALDLCLWLMGFPKPVRVTGVTKVNFAKGHRIPGAWGEWDRRLFSVEDFAAGFIHFENGATMTFESAWLGHQPESEELNCQLYGLNGGLKWPSGEFATTQGRALVQGTVTGARAIDKPFTAEIKAFHDAVVEHRPSPVPWTETINVIAILEAIYASQKRGRELTLR